MKTHIFWGGRSECDWKLTEMFNDQLTYCYLLLYTINIKQNWEPLLALHNMLCSSCGPMDKIIGQSCSRRTLCHYTTELVKKQTKKNQAQCVLGTRTLIIATQALVQPKWIPIADMVQRKRQKHAQRYPSTSTWFFLFFFFFVFFFFFTGRCKLLHYRYPLV